MKSESENRFRPGQGDAFKSATEVAFLAEEVRYTGFLHHYKANAKFIIPVLVPLMKSSVVINEKQSVKVTSNGKTYSANEERTNYITVPIPLNVAWKYIRRCKIKRFSFHPDDTNLYIQIIIPKDTEFLLNFVGEDINKIRIIGVNERGSDVIRGITPII